MLLQAFSKLSAPLRGFVRPPMLRRPGPVTAQQARSLVYNDSGSILERPEQERFAVVKVLLVVIPFTYLGGTISKNGAAFLEENDIFVPSDDDD